MADKKHYPPDPECISCNGSGRYALEAYGGEGMPCPCTETPRVGWGAVQGPEIYREMIQIYNELRSTDADVSVLAIKVKAEFRDALERLELSDTEAAELLWTSPNMIRLWLRKPKPGKPIKVPNAQAFCILEAAMTDPNGPGSSWISDSPDAKS